MCASKNQECRDVDKDVMSPTSHDSWECGCVPPEHAPAGIADRGWNKSHTTTCIIDECLQTCPTCAGTTCSDAGQTCEDPDKATHALNNWVCKCVPPGTGQATAKAADCIFDECKDAATNKTCSDQGQVCVDKKQAYDATATPKGPVGDWECHCPAPSDSIAVAAAVSPCVHDECTEKNATCTAVGQTCSDPNTDLKVAGDWKCTCPPPSVGEQVAGAATCVLDECTTTCAGCENDLCKNATQDCVDPDTSPKSTGDWKCVCKPHAVGEKQAAAADCILDECLRAKDDGSDKNTKTCAGAPGGAQTCFDPDTSEGSTDDWECQCPPPTHGVQKQGVAQCRHDECADHASTCTSKGQVCNDTNDLYLSKDDWKCTCVPPARGDQMTGAANCTLDECVETCPTCEADKCGNQTCVDPNPSPGSTMDWECRCVPPSKGAATGKFADCTLDECTSPKAGGGTNADTCTAANQTCIDQSTHPNSKNDWQCICPAPSVGRGNKAAANCEHDECKDKGSTCTGAGQTCNDPNIAATSLHDWTCTCPPPSLGQNTAGAARCTLDECVQTCPTCQDKGDGKKACEDQGQICYDPTKTPDQKKDWTCTCPVTDKDGKATGQSGTNTAGPANCEVDECRTKQSATICAANDQTCVDTDKSPGAGGGAGLPGTGKNDFECACPSPATLKYKPCSPDTTGRADCTGTVQKCEYDECTEGGKEAICQQAGQTCKDNNIAVASVNDWTCTCAAPGIGSAQLKAAECTLDECVDTCPTCAAGACKNGQTCTDPVKTPASTGDWVCKCPPPSKGMATAKTADCYRDECEEHVGECTQGCRPQTLDCQQTCEDPTKDVIYDASDASQAGDWICKCPPPSTDQAVAKGAICTTDPCVHDTEEACDMDTAGCDWKLVPTPTCTKSPCTDATEAKCTSNPDCEWTTDSGQVGGSGQATFETGKPVKPFPTVKCSAIPGSAWTDPSCSCSMMLGTADTQWIGAAVSITTGFQKGEDTLSCKACALLSPVITEEWLPNQGVLFLKAATGATADVFAQAIASVEFQTSSTNGNNRRISWNFGHAAYSGTTGRYYKHFSADHCKSVSASASCSWDNGKALCANDKLKIMGLTGYLLTVTSAEEDQVARGTLPASGWMGAKNSGGWKWVTGPDALLGAAADIGTGSGASFKAATDPKTGTARFTNWDAGSAQPAGSGSAIWESPTGLWKVGAATDGVVCEWGGKDGQTVGNLCLESNWATGAVTMSSGVCTETKCTETNEQECKADPYCDWVPGSGDQCTQKPCTERMNEKACYKDEDCYWDTSIAPAICTQEPCRKHQNQGDCDADAKCMWDPAKSPAKCMEKDCSRITTACECRKETGCFWDTTHSSGQPRCMDENYAQCPTLDVIVILDGTQSLNAKFGRHPSGQVAVIETLKDWAAALPLTNEARTVGKASTAPQGGLRLAFIQFGGMMKAGSPTPENTYRTTPSGTGTSGTLSGLYAEIKEDLEWHESNNLNAPGSYLKDAVSKAADIFSAASPDTRTKVLITMSDGAIEDSPDFAQLNTMGVKRFGVVVRKYTASGTDDQLAEQSLRGMTSQPNADHFQNVYVDDLDEQVFAGLCNPTNQFGKIVSSARTTDLVHKPCSQYADSVSCAGDKGCTYSAAFAKCVQSPCFDHCTESDCVADKANNCEYDKTDKACWKEPLCAHTVKGDCENDVQCDWNETAVPKCQERDCNQDNKDDCVQDKAVVPGAGRPATTPCEWDNQNSRCDVKPCVYTDQTNCGNDPECEWHECASGGAPATCEKKRCSAGAEAECTKDSHCKWTTKCERKTCTINGEERCCNADTANGCKWDVTSSPGQCNVKYCKKLDQTQCGNDPDCDYVGSECVDKKCSKYDNDRCACESDPTCYWKLAPNGNDADAICVPNMYGQCPTMDIVLLISGRASMSGAFDMHPNGFTGVVEAVRDWTVNLPLSREAAGTTPKPNYGRSRIAVVQFGGTDKVPPSVPGQADSQYASGTTGGADGRLSGVNTEIGVDLNWHMDNYYNAGSMIATGLEKANTILGSAPQDGRRRVVIIISDSKLYDDKDIKAQKAALANSKAVVFGVALKPLAARNMDDAVDSLATMAESDQYVQAVTLDELTPKVFEDLCLPSGTFGQYLAEKVTVGGVHQPCNQQIDKDPCNNDPGCVWTSGGCGNSPCLTHCDQTTCEADTANKCEWGTSCTKKKTSCVGKPEQACKDDSECDFDTVSKTCTDKKCVANDESSCIADPDPCVWNNIDKTCGQRPCLAETEADCKSDPACEWAKYGTPDETYAANKPSTPFASLTCDANGNTCAGACAATVTAAVVNIEQGYMQGKDMLSCGGCTGAISAKFEDATGQLWLTNPAGSSLTDFAAAIATVTFTTSDATGGSRRVTWNYGDAVFSSVTGNYYKHIKAADCGAACDWYTAQAKCESTKVLGLDGYLATITSDAENAAAKALGGQGWIGASDVGTEGKWRWVTGPEGQMGSAPCTYGAGKTGCDVSQDATGTATGADKDKGMNIGSAAGGTFTPDTSPITGGTMFAAWAAQQPDNSKAPCDPASCFQRGQDFAALLAPSGQWADRADDEATGAVCEYGGLGTLCMANGAAGTKLLTGGRCDKKKCDGPDEPTCEADSKCDWDQAAKKCTDKPCTEYLDETTCNQDGECDWNTKKSPPECGQKQCATYDTEVKCGTNSDCTWGTAKQPSARRQGGTYVFRNELSCSVGKGSTADYDNRYKKSVADWKECAQYCNDNAAVCTCFLLSSSNDCVLRSNCEFNLCTKDATQTAYAIEQCVQKSCNDETKCPCKNDPDCFWDETAGTGGACKTAAFGQCPTMDVAVLFDGSDGMSKAFGRHTNGYVGVVEVLKDWAAGLPLSGESATVGSAAVATGQTRVAFVQFSGKNKFTDPQGKGYGEIVDATRTPPTGTGAGGKLSGSLKEITSDLTWQEGNQLLGRTFVAPALKEAATIFQGSPNGQGRKRVVIIVADEAIEDENADLATAQASLKNYGASVLGVVLRKSATASAGDQAAETALKAVLSTPQTGHFKMLEVDELGDALDKICDPNDKWGEQIVGPPVKDAAGKHLPCGQYQAEVPCNADIGCVWNSQVPVCADSPCVKYCEQADCVADKANMCAWKGGECWKDMPCTQTDAGSCNADPDCKWIDGCTGYADNCKWNGTTKCFEKPCVKTKDPTKCPQDPMWDCVWDTVNGQCIERPCQHTSQGPCDGDANCEWDADCGDAKCVVKPCQATDQTECIKDGQCKFEGSPAACSRKTCAELNDEKCCAEGRDGKCDWDVSSSPGICLERPCVKHQTEALCNTKSGCAWDSAATPPGCDDKRCDKLSRCDCEQDLDCAWVASDVEQHCTGVTWGSCPTMDIYLLVDGGESMKNAFGNHPHGFVGLMEVIRDWVNDIPLSGDANGATPKAGTQKIRVGMVQFGGTTKFASSHEKQFAMGPLRGGLSGSSAELKSEIDWHENNFIMSSTFIMQALEYAADMFRTSPAGRKRVLLIITDGKIQDAAQIGNARSTLTVLGVQTFGVVIRRLESHTQTDIDAEETLRAIVSEDRDDHLMNVALDGFAQDVLGDFCNPTGKFGKLIAGFDPHEAAKQHKHLPCELYTDQRDCEADSGCVFNQKTLLCTKSKCQVQCSDGECTGFAEETCKWAGDVCYRKPVCDAEEQSPCEAQTYTNKEGNPENCYWYSNDICGLRPCTAKEEDGCRADPYYCEWDDSLGAAGECKVNPCKPVLPEEDCNKLPTCAYNKKMQQCVKKHCVYDEEKCKKHAFACDWDGTTCKPKPCAAHDEEAVCSDDPDCEWTVDHSPGYCVKKKCRTYDGKDECTTGDGANWACDWNEQDKACDEGRDLCTNRTSECTCKQTPGCLWDVDRCFASSFSTCPVMDVVMLFTGANSMQLEFGRHPNGYFGMMEIMADWVRHLPLTGERVGDPPKKQTATSGVRVGLVQFSDKGAARRTPTTVPNAAAGSITGSIDQANIDLKWHEWNPAKGDNYIAQGMSFASIMFKQTPADRKKVLMIITDSEIPEISRLTASRAALDSMRVETFGVLLRRFTTVMPDDEKAASSLKPLTSEPTDAHFQSITLGEFGKLLYGICDENTPFGYYIGAHGEPRHQHCPDYKVQRDCFLDTLCAWKNNLCIPSDCPDNCDEGSCAGKKDQDGGCEWDATDKACAGALCGGTDKETCEKDALCYWEISEQKCSPKAGCQSIPCDIFDMECIKHTTCDESPLGCKWDMGNNICTDTRACMIYKGKAECQTNTKCQWNSALNTCEDKNGCALYNAQEPCGQDKNCMWDTENTICVDRSCGVYKSEVTCTGDPLCTWNATQCKDKGDCASLTTATDAQAKCIADDRCDWVADNSTCVKKPTQTGCRRHAEQNPCDDDIACQWNGAKSQCEDSTECVTHTDSTACLANNCEWFDKPLVSTALCGKRCASNTAQTPCDAQTTCDWDGNKCVTKDPCTMPSLRNDEAECNNLIVCQYKNASGCAKVNCAAISPGGGNSSGGCDAEPKCETKGSMCVQKDNCPFFKDQNNCECGVATNCDKTCAYDTPNKQCAKIKDKCNVYNQAECDQQEACTWDTAAAPAVCKTKCSCTAGGECVAAGADKCCACNAGFTGADCSTCLGAVVNGKCLQCSRELTCSNHGDCDRDTSACICDIGWTGPDCSVQSCAPVGPWWFTTFPNRPQVSQMFSVIVHGCFDKPDDLRVIPKTTAGTDNTCAGFNADFAGGNLDTDDCRGKTGTPMIRDDKCKAIQPTATVEPQSRMELLINMTANWNSGEEETKEYVVCWKKSDGNWEPIKTHDRDGKTRDTLLVLSKPGDDAGSDMRGAATGEQGTYEECCEGLKFGEACLPTALVFILWALLIALIAKLVYDVIQSRKEKNELSAKSAKYADVDMEGGHEALNK
eukprot:TRINITY_DN96_c0_g1_i3.p1 TRINITY_DN96_c0_g1~~TRINITY_DN96_c0_g1_i3.p1  ORF type:complete len:5058 (+),score=1946.10 TRINITY_DN96_c0_g1_i3:478-15174(+)